MPIAAPLVPNAGMGPSPRMKITLNVMFIAVSATPSMSPVLASPADRRAPPSMKNTIMPALNRNMMRKKGRASAFTSGAAFTMSSRYGDTK